MRRSIWVLEVKNRNGSWGRSKHVGDTKKSVDPLHPASRITLQGEPGQALKFRMVKYVPRDTPWWRFWA